jgi:Ca2+-binding EF-hand superfamily protein
MSVRAHAEPRNAAPPVNGAKNALANGEQKLCQKLIAMADTDGNGQVTGTELLSVVRQYVQKQVAARFQRLDKNRDGRVARGEVPSMPAERFARFDANGDGTFTDSELEAAMHRDASERCRRIFAELDVDADGALSASDVKAQEMRLSKR